MIKKERREPPKIRALRALLRRLPPSHLERPRIESDLAKLNAGYRGEKSLNFQLSFLPEKSFLILHDLRLSDGNNHIFQMDTILLSPFFILILEIKNIAGTLYFDDRFHQLIRTIGGEEQGFLDPLRQVELQQLQLRNWLGAHKFPSVPVETLIVISNPSTVIKASPGNPRRFEKVIHASDLVPRIEKLAGTHSVERITVKEMRGLARRLTKKHTPHVVDVLAQYSVGEEDLRKGVCCPKCGRLPMARERGTWVCGECGASSKTAHVAALRDYALLLRPEITNQQCRDFLRLSSRITATKILKAMNLQHVGNTKGTKYWLSFDE